MNKNTKPTDRQLLQFVLRAQHLARKDARTEEGYAMMVVSIVTILLFSLLGAFMTMANLNKSSTNAYVDSTNTFYVAEAGLNRRAEQLRQEFIGYATPGGVSPVAVANCFGQATNAPATGNDFECRNYDFSYNRTDEVLTTSSNSSSGKSSLGGSNKITSRNTNVNYNAYTFVRDRTNFAPGTIPPAPVPTTIPAGQAFAGLNALEYAYTVFSTAAKPNAAGAVQTGDARTVLELTFRSRIVPLFQFAAFYNEDLEMTSTSPMTLSGNVHTNGNLYIQPTPNVRPAAPAPAGITTYLWSPVTSAGQVYNRVQSSGNPRYSPPRFLRAGNPFTGIPAPTYYPDNNFGAAMTGTPLTTAQIAAYGGRLMDGAAGAQVLRTPDAGFLRKRNYVTNEVGEYYRKADIRLEMVPDRGTNKTTTPWTPNSTVIPFNFTSIQTGGTGACTTTAPAAGTDPAINYIDPTRQNAANLRCNVFRKGQLQSLRQPVMVRTNLNQADATSQTTEKRIWNPANPANPAADPTNVLRRPPLPGGIPVVALANRNAVLRALQVAIVSTPIPITLDALNTPLNNTIYNTDSLALTDGSLLTFRTRFAELLNTGVLATALTPANRTALLSASPNAIAAIDEAWFLPAPIQRVEHGNPATNLNVPTNTRRSGFYDGRERRWITMLQTNIVSLAVWNRDGLFVEATNETMNTFYASDLPSRTTAFNNGNGGAGSPNSTAGLAFLRAPATGAVGLPSLGLGASDGVVANTPAATPTTEGGLVFYSTVNDDLNGNGAIDAADDITTNGSIFRQDSLTNTPTADVVDLRRSYLGGANTGVSPFGFAFNGGDYLPSALTLATDQPVYIQGNFNNNGADQPLATPNNPSLARRPAAIMADTITILSNQCLPGSSRMADGTIRNFLATPTGQINCGLPNTGRRPTGEPAPYIVFPQNLNFYTVTSPTAVNAAFLSSTVRSCGNDGVGRACGANPATHSGAINNYIRMLEGWGQIQFFNYSGSFVSLGPPLEHNSGYTGGTGVANGTGTGNYYDIPIRNFNFDNNFNNFNSLPPLSPRAIFLQQDVFRRNY